MVHSVLYCDCFVAAVCPSNKPRPDVKVHTPGLVTEMDRGGDVV